MKTSSLASGALLIPSFLKAFEGMSQPLAGDKKLVIIQLSGGNDGLNTIIPFRNDIYYQMRPNLAISASKTLKVGDELGFHPALAPLRSVFDNGEMSIINNVGYPNPDRSHFRSLDIWQSASNSDEYLTTGWLGRYLDSHCKSPHQVIEVDDMLSLALKGERFNGIAVKDPKALHQTTNGAYIQRLLENNADEHLSEDNKGYLFKTMVETSSSAEYIYETSKTHSSSVEYVKTALSKQLRTVAQFINSGLSTKVYYVSMGGFDTHVNQVGSHERLLENYANSVASFIKDLKQAGTFDDTLIMTFSEFGRRVQQNGSVGTDHGTANNLFVMGGKLKKAGFYNNPADLTNLDKNGDLKYDIDFRRVYASILDGWLDVPSQAVLGRRFEGLGLV